MNQQKFWTEFPLGTHICREPMPSMDEMKHDMEIMRDKGFNLIKIQEHWMIDEPEEGVYDFSHCHELIEHAAKLGMGVYLGLTCEQAPNWLYKKYPDCRMETRDGQTVEFHAQTTLHADGKPGPCFDHAMANEAQLRFIRKLVESIGVHENIVVWNTWQEIGYWSEMLTGDSVCYCNNTIHAYRDWLREVYGSSIEKLNRHWNAAYPSFESIDPDRCHRLVCVPQMYYYHYFINNVKIAKTLKARYDVIREADPLKRPVFAHKGGPAIGSGVDWTYGRTQDFLGVSNYPAWGSGHMWDDHKQTRRLDRHDALLTEMWDALAMGMDYIRSASRQGAPVWAAEYQGGPVSTDFQMGRVPNADDMRRWMLTTLGAGATAICFWVTRAEIMAPETNGFGLLDSEGDTTERLEEAARVGRAVAKYPQLFASNNKQKARVALLVNEWNYELLNTMPFAPDVQVYDLRGWYKTLWSLGIPCDFIEAGHLAELQANDYRAIIVPMPLSMSDQVAKDLIDYAELGGKVILEGCCGRLNEVGLAERGQLNQVLKSVLEIKVNRMSLVREPDEDDRWSLKERTWGEYEDAGFLSGAGALSGIKLKANIYVETYDCNPGAEQVCLQWNGKAAGVVRTVGKGKIWLLGTAIGPSGTAHVEESSLAGIRQLLEINGVVAEHSGKLLVQKRLADSLQAWFFTNPCREAVTEAVQIPAGYQVENLLDNAYDQYSQTISVEPLDVQVLILKKV